MESSSLTDFLKLLIALPKSPPRFLSFLVPNNRITMPSISNNEVTLIPPILASDSYYYDFLLFFSSCPEIPNLDSNSLRISLELASLKDKRIIE